MNAKALLRQIEQDITEGRTEEAITAFAEWIRERDEEAHHRCLTLAAGWKKFKEESRAGILSPEESERRHNKIHYDLLLLAREYAKTDESPISPVLSLLKRNTFTLIGILWTVAALTGLWLWLSKAPCVDINVEIISRGLELTSSEDGSFFDGQSVREAQLQNYRQLTIPADTIDIDWDLDERWDARLPVQTSLVLQPEMDGSTLLKNVRLASLDFVKGTFIAFETVGSGGCNLNLGRAASAEANFYLTDTLNFQSSSNTISGWDAPQYDGEPFRGQIAYATTPPNLNVEAAGQFQLLLNLEESASITEDLLRVDTVRWETTERTPQGPKQKSTIIGGQLEVLSTSGSITLRQGESLRLRPAGSFYLKKLSREPAGLRSVFTGQVDALSLGLTPEQLTSCMPTRLEKAWATQKTALLLLPALLIAFSLWLLFLKRKSLLAYEN